MASNKNIKFSSVTSWTTLLSLCSHLISLKCSACLYVIMYCTGYGRKNSPIWKGHSFGWGARRRTAVYVPFSVYSMRTSSLYCWGVYKKWPVAGSISGGRRVRQIWPPAIFSLGLNQSKGLRTTSPNFGSSEGGDTTGSCCIYTWNDSQGHGQLPREATSVYQYSRPPLEW